VIGIGVLDPHVKRRGDRPISVSGYRVQDCPFDCWFVDDGHPYVLHQGKRPPAAQGEARRTLPLDWPIAIHVEVPLAGSMHAEMCMSAGSLAFEVQLGILGAGSQAPPPRAFAVDRDPESQDAAFIRHTCLHPAEQLAHRPLSATSPTSEAYSGGGRRLHATSTGPWSVLDFASGAVDYVS
jgi:hypothetical protein